MKNSLFLSLEKKKEKGWRQKVWPKKKSWNKAEIIQRPNLLKEREPLTHILSITMKNGNTCVRVMHLEGEDAEVLREGNGGKGKWHECGECGNRVEVNYCCGHAMHEKK